MKKLFQIALALIGLATYYSLSAQTNTGATQTANKPATTSQKPIHSKTEQELRKIVQEMIDADLQTDEKVYKKVYERYLADNYISVASTGKVSTKKEALDFDPPRPSDHYTESLEDIQVLEHGDNAATALVTYKESFVENGQTVTMLWRITDTYTKQNGQWKMTVHHSSRIPNPIETVKVDPAIYDAYVGQYQLNDEFLTVSRDGDKLMAQTTLQSGKKHDFEFLPMSETHFFIKDQPDQVTFVKDDQGKVSYILHRYGNGQEVKEMKVK